jgi:Na+-transporting NADH:ubiquinone oxidoreductase subunit NqrB
MSTRASRDRASRAEARRRARAAARGDQFETSEDEDPVEQPAAAERGGFLRRIFPPAPPLPDKPDPLAKFDRDGSMIPVRERAFLLRQNPMAWVLPGALSFLGLYASFFYGGSLIGMLATFVQFGALIAAGWFGWQRPTLYGTAAGVMGGALTAALVLFDFLRLGVAPEDFGGPGPIVTQMVLTIVWQAAFGFIGGWYGGYLRRRQSQINRDLRRRR